MELKTKAHDEAHLHLGLAGRMDHAGVNLIRDELTDQLASCPSVLILDLGKVNFIVSAGLGLLLDIARKAEQQKVTFIVSNAQPMVAQSISIAQVDKIVPLAESNAAARKQAGL